MASAKPFNFLDSRIVAPIICTDCGNNAHCIRRTPDSTGRPYEYQAFECVECRRRSVRTVGTSLSDEEVEATAEKIAGVSKDARRPPDLA